MRLGSRRPSLIGVLHAGAIVTALFSLVTFADSLHRYVELFSHFRLQYLGASLLLSLILTALRSRAWASLMLVITVINVWPVAIWYVAGTEPHAVADTQIELLQANVYSGNDDTRPLLELIKAEQPDIVFLQEVTDLWVTAMDGLQTSYPHRYAVPRNDNFGVAVYAREPLLKVDVIESPPHGFPSLVVNQSLGGRIITFVTTHPIPPLGKPGFDARNEQLDSMAKVIASLPTPIILSGDLNTTMWAHHYKQFEEATGLVNSRRGIGIVPTWPRQLPFAMIPIDHCLVSDDFAVQNFRTGPDIGSDHLPLIVELVLL